MVFLLTVTLTVGYGLLFLPSKRHVVRRVVFNQETGEEEIREIEVDPLRPIHILLLGCGGGTHAGGTLADTIIVAQIIPKNHLINLFSIPRDLWVRFPIAQTASSSEPLYGKINRTLAIGNGTQTYAWRPERYQGQDGGGNLARDVVSNIIGQDIDYYVTVDFAGFKHAIDLITGSQGLSVDVPYSFVDEFYPIDGLEDDPCGYSEEEIASLTEEFSGYELEQKFACRYEKLEFNAGPQLISSEELLKFVRSRHSGYGGGDFGRSRRQQVVIEAVKNKVFSVNFLPKVPQLAAQLLRMLQTDVDLDYVNTVLADYDNVRSFQVNAHVLDNATLLQDGRSGDGQYILRPRAGEEDYGEIRKLVADALEVASVSATLAQ